MSGYCAENIRTFRPDPEHTDLVRRWLQERGVVTHATDFSLACSAPPAVFEQLFAVKLVAFDKVPGGAAWKVAGRIRVPEETATLVEDITLPRAPELF